jgi:hypothetical protein
MLVSCGRWDVEPIRKTRSRIGIFTFSTFFWGIQFWNISSGSQFPRIGWCLEVLRTTNLEVHFPLQHFKEKNHLGLCKNGGCKTLHGWFTATRKKMPKSGSSMLYMICTSNFQVSHFSTYFEIAISPQSLPWSRGKFPLTAPWQRDSNSLSRRLLVYIYNITYTYIYTYI